VKWENRTVEDSADETKEDHRLVIVTCESPVILNFNAEEKAAHVKVCEYCGHFPCGCGG
jgi:hypothetical protein